MNKTALFACAFFLFQGIPISAEARGFPCAPSLRVNGLLAAGVQAPQGRESAKDGPLEILAMGDAPDEDALSGNKLVLAGETVVGLDAQKNELLLWDWKDLKSRGKIKVPEKTARFTVSSDRKSVFILAENQIIMVDVAQGKEIKRLDVEHDGLSIYSVSPDCLLIGGKEDVAVFSMSKKVVVDRIKSCGGNCLLRVSDDRVLADGGMITISRSADGSVKFGYQPHQRDYSSMCETGRDGMFARGGHVSLAGKSYLSLGLSVMNVEGERLVRACAGAPASSIVVAAEDAALKVYDFKTMTLMKEVKTIGKDNRGLWCPRSILLNNDGGEAVVWARSGLGRNNPFRLIRIKVPGRTP